MSHIWTTHVSLQQWLKSQTWMSHITRVNESWHTGKYSNGQYPQGVYNNSYPTRKEGRINQVCTCRHLVCVLLTRNISRFSCMYMDIKYTCINLWYISGYTSRALWKRWYSAKETYKRDDILQKRAIFLGSLLIAATPYIYVDINFDCIHDISQDTPQGVYMDIP